MAVGAVIVFDPVPWRRWPRQFIENYRYLFGRTLGRTWRVISMPLTDDELALLGTRRPRHARGRWAT